MKYILIILVRKDNFSPAVYPNIVTTKRLVISYGEGEGGGLQNGKITCPKIFVSPPLPFKEWKLFAPPPLFNMAKPSSYSVKTTSTPKLFVPPPFSMSKTFFAPPLFRRGKTSHAAPLPFFSNQSLIPGADPHVFLDSSRYADMHFIYVLLSCAWPIYKSIRIQVNR